MSSVNFPCGIIAVFKQAIYSLFLKYYSKVNSIISYPAIPLGLCKSFFPSSFPLLLKPFGGQFCICLACYENSAAFCKCVVFGQAVVWAYFLAVFFLNITHSVAVLLNCSLESINKLFTFQLLCPLNVMKSSWDTCA